MRALKGENGGHQQQFRRPRAEPFPPQGPSISVFLGVAQWQAASSPGDWTSCAGARALHRPGERRRLDVGRQGTRSRAQRSRRRSSGSGYGADSNQRHSDTRRPHTDRRGRPTPRLSDAWRHSDGGLPALAHAVWPGAAVDLGVSPTRSRRPHLLHPTAPKPAEPSHDPVTRSISPAWTRT